jgi:hypothetical protein
LAKQNLVNYATQQEALKSSTLKSTYNTQDANKQLAAMVADGDSFETIKSTMAQKGIYLLDQSIDSISTTMTVGSSDIHMSAPIISYNSYDGSWSVTGGGWWTDNNWESSIGLAIGNTYNMGGVDGYGVAFTSTKGTYNTSVISQYSYISDDSNHTLQTYNRSDGNGALGFGFRQQDYAVRTGSVGSGTIALWDYVGKHFADQVVYDRNFVNYSGVATSYYIHTWSSASISSVTFGVEGKTAGVSASISDVPDSFTCFSTDTKF